MIENSMTPFFASWRRVVLDNRVILDGIVRPEHQAGSSEIDHALRRWPGVHYWPDSPDGRRLVLVREGAPQRERWWLHGLLLAAAVMTMSAAGAEWLPRGLARDALHRILHGLSFSLPLAGVLIAHEAGHYFTARRYRVDASPPYFLPFPASLSIIGTLGAFIRLRSPIFDRRTLFDIGIAGPLAGLAVALPVLALGLSLSDVAPNAPAMPLAHQFVVAGSQQLFVGDSLLLTLLRLWIQPDGVLRLHPLAVAGWVGVLVTMLNLLPLAQFDGGHVIFALLGRRQVWVARATWLALIVLGWLYWPGWWVSALLALAVNRGRLAHPRVIDAGAGLDRTRRIVGWLVVALLVLCFMPAPVSVR